MIHNTKEHKRMARKPMMMANMGGMADRGEDRKMAMMEKMHSMMEEMEGMMSQMMEGGEMEEDQSPEEEREAASGGKAPLGSGQRFAELKAKLAKRAGAKDPAALAAWIGRKKYGAKKMAQLSAGGRKRAKEGGTVEAGWGGSLGDAVRRNTPRPVRQAVQAAINPVRNAVRPYLPGGQTGSRRSSNYAQQQAVGHPTGPLNPSGGFRGYIAGRAPFGGNTGSVRPPSQFQFQRTPEQRQAFLQNWRSRTAQLPTDNVM